MQKQSNRNHDRGAFKTPSYALGGEDIDGKGRGRERGEAMGEGSSPSAMLDLKMRPALLNRANTISMEGN
jgi:hypothetical protein